MGAVATLERTDSKVDTRRIDAARAAAVVALGNAYLPHEVEQPGGARPLYLCWSGRIARAYDRLAAAREDAKRRGDKDDATVKAIQKSIDALTAKYAEAQKLAEDAAANWAALAAAGDVTVDPMSVYPAACTCDGCKAAAAWHDHNEARGKYSDALYTLLAPNSSDRPPLYELLEAFGKTEKDRDRFWAAMKTIYDNAKAYDAACRAAGVQANWRAALYPGEG
jgi:hypothetical protein